jgi:carboxyl-terminal processing protease
MNKNWLVSTSNVFFGLLLFLFLYGIPSWGQSEDNKENKKEIYKQLNLFGEVFDRIRSTYVEEVKSKDLIEAAINGMLSSLDPHSGYLPPESFEDMQVDTKGAFGGLGIEVTQEDGFVKVVSPMDGTPAFEAGIKSGDFITHVDGVSILGLSLGEAVDKMRGPVGSEISLTVVRDIQEEPFDVLIIRDVIKLTAAKVRTEGSTIILRVTTFNEQTTPNLKTGLKNNISKVGGIDKVSGFIIDLRNNPGGLLSEAISVSDMFLEQGEIVSTRGRSGEKGTRYDAEKGDLAVSKPIVVLINGGSASASEIVAGALQDHKRAVIIGTKSFGKGSVQTILPMGGSGAMRLTTARYYTPSGRSIQSLGVVPDIIVELQQRKTETEKQEEDKTGRVTEADLRGALSNDSLSQEESDQLEEEKATQKEIRERREADNQMAYALDIILSLTILQGE